MSVSIREANLADIEGIGQWYLQFWEEKEDADFGLALHDEKPDRFQEMRWFLEFQEACAKGDAIGLVAESEGEIVGFCEVNRVRPPRCEFGSFGRTLSVRKQSRGRGVGSALLKEMIERSRGKFEFLELEVFAGNPAAKHIYEKNGFKAYGLRPQSVKRNGEYVDDMLMHRKL